MPKPSKPWPNDSMQERFVVTLKSEFNSVSAGMVKHVRDILARAAKAFPKLAVEWDYLNAKNKSPMTLAELASAQTRELDSLEEGFHIGRWIGRGNLARIPLEIDWYPINGPRTTADLEVTFEMADVPIELFPRVRELVDAFFAGAAKAGALRSASGSVRVVHAQWPHQYNESRFKPPIVEVEELAARDDMPPKLIPSIQWITWLGPDHLQKLGGRSAFLERAREFLKASGITQLIVLPHGKEGVLVECGVSTFDPECAEYEVFDELDFEVNCVAATWFAQELVKAELFAWQHWKPTWNKADNGADSTSDDDDAMDIDDDFDDAPSRKAHIAKAASRHDELWKVLSTTPPECFSDTPANPTAADRRWARQNYGEMATCFVVADDQGRTSLPLWVRLQDDHMVATDPIFVGHPSLKDSCFAFQSHRHGYNGKQGLNHWPRRKAPDLFHCPRCGKDKFRVLTVFQYSGDEDDESDPRVKRSPQDFFSWLAIRATCSACKWVGTIADIECA